MQMQAAFKCVVVKKSSERKETRKKERAQTKRRTELATTTVEMDRNVKNKQKKWRRYINANKDQVELEYRCSEL